MSASTTNLGLTPPKVVPLDLLLPKEGYKASTFRRTLIMICCAINDVHLAPTEDDAIRQAEMALQAAQDQLRVRRREETDKSDIKKWNFCGYRFSFDRRGTSIGKEYIFSRSLGDKPKARAFRILTQAFDFLGAEIAEAYALLPDRARDDDKELQAPVVCLPADPGLSDIDIETLLDPSK